MDITFTNFICFILLLVTICAFCLVYLEQDNIKKYFSSKHEKLVGIVRVKFSIDHIGMDDDYDFYSYASSHYADVYCYENEAGKRKLNINPYNYSGSYSHIKNSDIYAKLKDWKSGRSNLFNFPSCQQVLNGSNIITLQS
jgi:hypothetical protein